jgi:hypothetical protein
VEGLQPCGDIEGSLATVVDVEPHTGESPMEGVRE